MKYYAVFILSAISLILERLWNVFWDSILLILLFMGLSLLEIPQSLPDIFNLLFITVFIALIAFRITLKLGKMRRISINEIKRKIEHSSNIKHRPLDAIIDHPLQQGLENTSVWKKHLANAQSKIKSLKSYMPRFTVAREDVNYTRYIVPAFLLLTMALTPFDYWLSNLQSGITPKLQLSALTSQKKTLEVWITPPAYTKAQASFIISSKYSLQNGKEIKAVKGSVLKARASGYFISPYIMYNGKVYNVGQSDTDKNILSINLEKDGDVKLFSISSPSSNWPLKVVEDKAPEVSINKLSNSALAATKIEYEVNEDYGIQEIEAFFKLADAPENKVTYKFTLNYDAQTTAQTHIEDLSSSIWAGKEVDLFIKVKDTFNHVVESKTSRFILPERQFKNSIARRIIEARKMVMTEEYIDNKVITQEIAENLADIAIHPHLYKWNIVSFMALNSAIRRIVVYKDKSSNIIQLLWDVALQLEDGGVSTAQRKLYQSLQKMQNSIAQDNLSDQEKQAMVQEVQKAIMEYLQNLANEMNDRFRQGKGIPSLPDKLAEKLKNSVDMKTLLKKMQEMAQTSSYKSLAEMAKALQKNIENFDISKMEEMQKNTAEAIQSVKDLEEITKKQQLLLDETNKVKDQKSVQDLPPKQLAIKKQLSDVTEKLSSLLPEIPQSLATAYNEMSQSAENLQKAFAKSAALHQEASLKELQNAMDKTTDKLAEGFQNSLMSFGFMPEGNNYGENYDPLGRKLDTEEVKIPGQSELRTIKQIIEELRKRSNDSKRKDLEREYLERLID